MAVPTLLPSSTKIVIKGNDDNPFRSAAEIRDGVQVIEIDESVPDEKNLLLLYPLVVLRS